jgi:hypothetical protein
LPVWVIKTGTHFTEDIKMKIPERGSFEIEMELRGMYVAMRAIKAEIDALKEEHEYATACAYGMTLEEYRDSCDRPHIVAIRNFH